MAPHNAQFPGSQAPGSQPPSSQAPRSQPNAPGARRARGYRMVAALSVGAGLALLAVPGVLDARSPRRGGAPVGRNFVDNIEFQQQGFGNQQLLNRGGRGFMQVQGRGPSGGSGAGGHAPWDGRLTAGAVKVAVTDGIAFLRTRITPEGALAGTYDAVGETSLAALAMLAAGLHPTADTDLARALTWLQAQDSDNTYARAIRATVWEYALRKVPQVSAWAEALDADRQWLLDARNAEGWRYSSRSTDWDNSCTQYGVLGLWAAQRAGHTIPPEVWRDLNRHFLKVQVDDGGWGYTHGGSSANMVTAGLASLFLVFDQLHGGAVYRQGQTPPYAEGDAAAVLAGIERGMSWLASHGGADTDPYYLYGIERVGVASGRTRIGGRDWFVEGARHLLAAQAGDGSMGGGMRGATAGTALSTLFLVYGGAPVAFAKYAWDADQGHWNLHPRDLANLSAALWGTFEQPLNWQVIEAEAPVTDIEAPVLLLSGAHAPKLTPAQEKTLAAYVARGGVLLAEPLDGATPFAAAMEALATRLFPGSALQVLPADHAVYTAMKQTWRVGPPPLRGVEVDGRLVMVLGDGRLSAAWQRNDREDDAFALATNLLYVAAGHALPPHRFVRTLGPAASGPDGAVAASVGGSAAPSPPAPPTRRVVAVAWGMHDAALDAAWAVGAPFLVDGVQQALKAGGSAAGEGAAKGDGPAGRWQPQASVLAGSQLEVAEDALAGADLVHLTGRGVFAPGAATAARLKRFVAEGGTLVVDAWEGDAAFAASSRAWLATHLGALAPLAEGSALAQGRFAGGVDLTRNLRVNLDARRAARARARAAAPGLEGAVGGVGGYLEQATLGRGRVLYTALDLASALGGRAAPTGPGFKPEASRKVFANLLATAGARG